MHSRAEVSNQIWHHFQIQRKEYVIRWQSKIVYTHFSTVFFSTNGRFFGHGPNVLSMRVTVEGKNTHTKCTRFCCSLTIKGGLTTKTVLSTPIIWMHVTRVINIKSGKLLSCFCKIWINEYEKKCICELWIKCTSSRSRKIFISILFLRATNWFMMMISTTLYYFDLSCFCAHKTHHDSTQTLSFIWEVVRWVFVVGQLFWRRCCVQWPKTLGKIQI